MELVNEGYPGWKRSDPLRGQKEGTGYEEEGGCYRDFYTPEPVGTVGSESCIAASDSLEPLCGKCDFFLGKRLEIICS